LPQDEHPPAAQVDPSVNNSITSPRHSNRLRQEAKKLARSQADAGRHDGQFAFRDHLRELEETLVNAYKNFASEPDLGATLAGEWLLDNFYVISQTIHQIREDMPKHFYRQLPRPGGDDSDGRSRIYAVAKAIIDSEKHQLEIDTIRQFILVYQRVTPLSMGELWALPTMLRMVALEEMARGHCLQCYAW